MRVGAEAAQKKRATAHFGGGTARFGVRQGPGRGPQQGPQEEERPVIPKDRKRLAEVDFPVGHDRPGCCWLYVSTQCDDAPRLQEPIRNLARLDWHEVTKVAHYYLSVDTMTRPMQVREDS